MEKTEDHQDLQFVDEEGVQLAEWLESVLKNYCMDLAKRKMAPGTYAPSTKNRLGKYHPNSAEAIRDQIYLFITSIKFDKYKKEVNESVEDMLKVEINYYVGDKSTRRNENFVIHVSRTVDSEREANATSIEKVLETDKREIDFYTKLVPEIEDWALNSGVTLKFGVPTCFFGEYETDKPPSMFKLDLPDPAELKKQLLEDLCSDCAKRGPKIETRAILIIHDLEKINFRFKGENQKLGIEETKAVLSELAQIHAASWAYQLISKKPLSEKWPFLLRPRDAVPVCVTLVEEGITAAVKFLTANHPNARVQLDLCKRLKAVKSKLTSIFYVLLTPPKAPSPSCLIHLDLQLRNLALRNVNGNLLPENHKLDVENIECRITQWKLASVGSPMHDVAFLFLTSLTPEDRRKHTATLIDFYFKAFRRTAKHLGRRLPFKLDFLESEYEKSLFLALLLIIGNFEEDVDIPEYAFHTFISALEDVADSGYL